MFTFLLILHFILTMLIIFLIVIQKKDAEGGVLGFGGGGSGAFTPRGETNIITKTTYILVTVFFLNCILIAKTVGSNKIGGVESLTRGIMSHTQVSTESDTKNTSSSTTDNGSVEKDADKNVPKTE